MKSIQILIATVALCVCLAGCGRQEGSIAQDAAQSDIDAYKAEQAAEQARLNEEMDVNQK